MNNYDDLLSNSPVEPQGGQLSREEYAAKKQAEREAVYEMSDKTALDVAGDGGKFRQYLDVQAKFTKYGTVNTLLIMAQNPEATRLGSFAYWKKQGGFVKPGQTGISILEPGSEYERRDGSGTAIGYNVKKVFDISQVDSRNIKTDPPPKYDERQLLRAIVDKAPLKITGVTELPNGGGAMTDPQTGEILVLKGMAFSDTFRSVAQELGYYEADADANKIPVNPSFVGYCTAYIISKKYGIDTQGFSFEAAPEVFRDLNTQGVKEQLSIIRCAADAITGRMAKQLVTADKAARSQEAR
jgi:hypothetical protein